MAVPTFHVDLVLFQLLLSVIRASSSSSWPDSDVLLFHQDYSPPAPPSPPPHPPSLSCESDIGGVGTLDTTCHILSDLNLTKNVYIRGTGNLVISPNVSIYCSSFLGCELDINVTGNFTLGENSALVCGAFQLVADNASFGNGSSVNTTGLAGSPPPQTSGTPQGMDGAGGGHGGRGAACLRDRSKLPEDVWGGDTYSWSDVVKPLSYGSRGGTTSREVDYGGGGGGRVMMVVTSFLEVNGSVLADGGDGGHKGGGGSGGSIYIKAYEMIGIGRISACGGRGFSGGGGGRVSVDVFNRHNVPFISVHGGSSRGCPENSGAAGTFYDTVPLSLTVSNHNKSTYTDTLLMDFPQPFLTNVIIENQAKAAIPLLWSRVQVQGQIRLGSGGVLSFGLAHYSMSEFEMLAEQLLMSDSVIRVFGALRMSVKMFLMWNSTMIIDGGGDDNVETSLLEASNLIVLKNSSLIHSNANLGVHGQGLFNLSGPGDCIEAQRLVLSLFYRINIGPGSIIRGPLKSASNEDRMAILSCESQDCPTELVHPPEDCNVNSSLSFTLQICRVEDIIVKGFIEGSIVHFHRAKAIYVHSSGTISSSGMGCIGGVGRGSLLSNGLGSGGGHGGRGGMGCYNDSCIEGGISYGDTNLPCELGSGSGNDSLAVSAGAGILVMGSLEHPLMNLFVEGSVTADGDSFGENLQQEYALSNDANIGPGGGSGGTILVFLHSLALCESGSLSSVGGHGSLSGGGGGGGGRIHFHWSGIPTGELYWPLAEVNGSIRTRGGLGGNQGLPGENGTVSGKACPKGLYGTFCEECPAGTYKNATGSDRSLCLSCPGSQLPNRGVYIPVRGGATKTPCPYKCVSGRYHMPHCYTALEQLVYKFGGPWWFGLLLLGLLILLALVLSVARAKFIGVDESPGSVPTKQDSQTDNSVPFLESLNEVLESNRVEKSQSHVHRMYFLGPNAFREPWHLPHTPPEQVKGIIYEGAFVTFVDEMNALAAYQWWEGSVHNVLCFLAYPLAWSWQQWRRRMKLQRLREFVRSEYDHACLRSCRSRALYEGLKVAATPDLMLAYIDFFLGGDERRSDLPPSLCQRYPISLLFGGDGSYMTPFSLHNDNIITNLMSQSVPPTVWYRFVAGLNAQLRLAHRGFLRSKFHRILRWLELFANPALSNYGVHADLAWFPSTTDGYCHYGLLVYAVDEDKNIESLRCDDGLGNQQHSRSISIYSKNKAYTGQTQISTDGNPRWKICGGILDIRSLKVLEERRDIFFLLSFLIQNTKPVGHQDLVGLVISILLLGDFSLVLLTLLQLYSFSLADVFFVLFILPLGILLPLPTGINALFCHGPRRSSGLARAYALWNITSLINVGVALICFYVHYRTKSSERLPFQPWNMDESEWWVFPIALLLCKCIQSRFVNWHVADLEIKDSSLYSDDFDLFWQS
ncbi:LOW QUALITY PROTEIN: uncharacterized protein LOC142527987 [Primulina tabacum]|uniref:LOW QUALITY PROTEIN: uncharacterized protein LOC142527987 n=1 Tax=Primulina tabacum TaxID=48773 RepID=UPI003F5A0352